MRFENRNLFFYRLASTNTKKNIPRYSCVEHPLFGPSLTLRAIQHCSPGARRINRFVEIMFANAIEKRVYQFKLPLKKDRLLRKYNFPLSCRCIFHCKFVLFFLPAIVSVFSPLLFTAILGSFCFFKNDKLTIKAGCGIFFLWINNNNFSLTIYKIYLSKDSFTIISFV